MRTPRRRPRSRRAGKWAGGGLPWRADVKKQIARDKKLPRRPAAISNQQRRNTMTMTRLGRKPQGAALVERLAGSRHAKRRLKMFLKTLAGQCRVEDACGKLGIGSSRFFDQRAEWLQEALALLEPRSPGRPPKAEPPISPEEVEGLRRRVRELEGQAAALEVQAELAQTLPHVLHRPRPGKKTRSTMAIQASRRAVRRSPK
jgi:hypothetical protein